MGRSKYNLAAQLVGFLLHISTLINAVMLIEKPQNVTFRIGDPLVFFNCSADTYFHTGFEWTFKSPFDEVKHIYNTAGDGNVCNKYPRYSQYKVECPNNLTVNLLIPFPNATDVGEYCCQVDNSRGVKLCAHLTKDRGDSVDGGGQTDLLKTGIETTQPADKSISTAVTEKDGEPQGDKNVLKIVIIVVLVVIIIVVVIVVVIVIRRTGSCKTKLTNEDSSTTQPLQSQNIQLPNCDNKKAPSLAC